MRKRLYKILLALFVSNIVFSAAFFLAALYRRSYVRELEETVLKTEAANRAIITAFVEQISINSNMVSFVNSVYQNRTNDVFEICKNIIINDFNYQLSDKKSSRQNLLVPDIKKASEKLPLHFKNYCELGGRPFVYLGRFSYTIGDFVHGREISDISPSAVEIEGEYYEIQN